MRFLLFALFPSFLFAQTNSDSLWICAHYEKQEVRIPMRDGITLFTSIYSPKDKAKQYPFLLNRTPYTCAPYGETACPPRNFDRYMHLYREGFIFVTQDVRGRFMSEGEFEDVRPHISDKKSTKEVDESSDTYDTVDWLLKNVENNNGKAGIFGISYPGFYTAAALPEAHPALVCASPQAPVTDWFIGDDFHHNGAFFVQDAFGFYYSFGQPRPELTQSWPPRFEYPVQDNYEFHLRTGAVKNYDEKYLKGKVKFWNDLTAHPNYDDFWKAHNIRPHLNNVRPAVMTVGGLFDAEDCWGAFATYKAIEEQSPDAWNVLVEGPWVHGGWVRTEGDHLGNAYFEQKTADFYKTNIELPFFKHFLKGDKDPNLPEAYIFTTGSNEWHRFEQWPPKQEQTEEISFYFTENGGLSTEKVASVKGYDEYVADPNKPVPYTEDVHIGRTREYMTDDQRFASRRPDVLTYQTDILEEDVTLLGPITADLFVSTTGSDADYVVKLIDVYPDTAKQHPYATVPMSGYQMLVRGEIFRARYRESFEHPKAIKPNNLEHVKFDLPDVAHTFKKGHRIMVQVQSSWFPLADRNPQQFVNIYECSDEDFIKATHKIYRQNTLHSGIHGLRLKE